MNREIDLEAGDGVSGVPQDSSYSMLIWIGGLFVVLMIIVAVWGCYGASTAVESCYAGFAVFTLDGTADMSKKCNQDAPITNPEVRLWGVCDGHGSSPKGEEFSIYVSENLPGLLAMEEGTASERLRQAIRKVSEGACKAIPFPKPFVKGAEGGTTLVCSVVEKDTIWTANLGDSRCVLGRANKGGLEAIPLSVDQDVQSNADERARVEGMGGHCSKSKSGSPILRVQGILANARAIGDRHVTPCIDTPVITSHEILASDKFIILASDGIWDRMENQEVVDIVGKHFPDVETATKVLVAEARSRWDKHPLRKGKKDDITVVVVSLKYATKAP